MNKVGEKSDLYEAIYEITRSIPRGRVTSFGAIAAALGMRSGARLVGYALTVSGNVMPPVPAHRVLNRNGLLSGKHHFGSPDGMKKRLEAEGIKVIEDKAVDFDTLFWDPATEIFIQD